MSENDRCTGGNERFVFDITCDEPGCTCKPTTWVGEIYYACRDHESEFRELIA